MLKDAPSRQQQVGTLSRSLAKHSQPKLQLLLILLLTASVGAGASFILLRSGLDRMWLRYPVAAILAYVTFLGLLQLWVRYQLGRLDLPRGGHDLRPGSSVQKEKSPWDLDWVDVLDVGSVVDDLPAFLIAAVFGIVIVLVGIVLAAPLLLAEILLDALLVAGLWRRFKRHARTSSLRSAVRATALPALIVVVCLCVIGFVLQRIDPSADSIGDFFRRDHPPRVDELSTYP